MNEKDAATQTTPRVLPGASSLGPGPRGRHGSARFAALTALCVGLPLLLASPVVPALMAGVEPDSPARRIDPNFASSSWACVGSVVVGGNPYSGVLITRRHVLTAAHVAGDPAQMQFVLNAGGDGSQQLAVKSVHRHPGWKGFDPKRPTDDLAILELAEPAHGDITIHPLATGTFTRGRAFVAVGYGASGHGDAGVTVGASSHVKRVGSNQADAFVTDPANGRVVGFLFDFDGPGSRNPLGGEGLGNERETTFATGDSGGPSFIRTASGWALFGINTFIFSFPDGSTKGSTFGTGGGGVVVTAYREWIEQVLRETQADPPGEGSPKPP